MERGRPSRGLLPLLALHALSEYSKRERKPPVTAGLLAANTIIYLRPAFLKSILPTVDEVAYNPHLILKHGDLKRFFLSPFYHIGDLHLFYNMLSLLWKGIQLETSLGSAEFSSLVAVLLALSQGITLILSKLFLLFDYSNYYNEYAVGFSGVLFAMKVILNSQSDNYSYVHGLLVPTRFAAWIELIIIQITVPEVSFLGHLGGILAGLLYLHLKKFLGYDPVRMIVKGVSGLMSWPLKFLKGLLGFESRQPFGRGVVGSSRPRIANEVWRCPACTYDNSYWLSVCDMCGTGRDGSGLSQLVELSPEELRRRRVERFNRR